MHYYQFNIADYRKDTQHLSPIEHYIYRELIDWYYLDETPIPNKTQLVMRRLRLVSENEENLKNVLEEFFFLDGEEWKHDRIEEEIAAYKRRAETAKVNGRKGGRPAKTQHKPRKTQPVNLANPEETGSKANHKPITNTPYSPPNRGKKEKDPTQKTMVAEGWEPSEKTEAWFAEQRFSFSLKSMVESYIDGCKAKGHKYLDHDSAFKNWAKRRDEGNRNSGDAAQQQAPRRPLL